MLEFSDDEEPDVSEEPPPMGEYDTVSALDDVPAQLHRDKRASAPTVPTTSPPKRVRFEEAKEATEKHLSKMKAVLRKYEPGVTEEIATEMQIDLVKLTKGGFGLAESPRLWYLCLRPGLLEIGLKELKLSPGTFVLHIRGSLRGILSIHVDDLRMAFHLEFQCVLDKLRQTFQFGEWQSATQKTVQSCGRWEKQCPLTFQITVTMDGYTHKLKEAPARNGQDRSPLSDAEKKWVASVGGQLNWMARQGRADLAYGISRVQQMAGARDPETIKLLNQLVKKAREPNEMIFKKLPGDMGSLAFLAVSDASHGSMPKGRPQGGMMVLVGNQEILEGPPDVTCLLYHSAVLKRVVRSSLAAEISQAAETLDQCEYVRAMLAEIWDANFVLQQWRWSASRWPEVLVLESPRAC
eukprot:s7910_g2.t1